MHHLVFEISFLLHSIYLILIILFHTLLIPLTPVHLSNHHHFIIIIIIIIILRLLAQSRGLKIKQLRLDMALTQI